MSNAAKTFFWILGILIVLGILYYLYTIGKLNSIAKSLGLPPRINEQGEVSHCNDTDENGNRINPSSRLYSTCLQPQNTALYLVVEGKVNEREWTKESLEKLLGELPDVNTQRPSSGFYLGGFRDKDSGNYVGGKHWTFNQIRGGDLRNDGTRNPTYYLYVDNTSYPNINNI